MKKIFFFSALLLTCPNIFAQKKWTGLGNDGLWNNQLNWSDLQLPADADSVVLDNANLSGNYTVTLPTEAVVVKYLSIVPSAGNKIELDLPVENILPVAFQVTGTGYGVTIKTGGVLKNASGATTGYGLMINDSLRINNGGVYIHNTKRSNANIVKMLSRAAGTEKGVFVFDVPGTTGYTPSVSGRTFGSLVFSANAAGKARTYTSTASSNVTVRGDLTFTCDVSYSVNFSKDLVIEGDLVQEGGVFNIATKANNNSVKIKGNLRQNAGAVITQSGSGLPSIELCGTNEQHIAMLGEIQNAIVVKLNNDNGASLDAPLSLPYELDLTKGIIKTINESLLTLEKGCTARVSDSLKNYVNGPLRKIGLLAEDFVFPVGEESGQPVELIGATGDITVVYKSNATSEIGTQISTPVKAIAQKGYWSIKGDNAGDVSVQLRYDNQVPTAENASIVMTSFENGQWLDKSTQPGLSVNGLLTSNPMNLASEPKIITFGALDAINALPVKFLSRNAQPENGHTIISWTISDKESPERFEIEGSVDGMKFMKVKDVAYLPGVYVYRSDVYADLQIRYFRIKAVEKDNKVTIDKVMFVPDENAASTAAIYSSANNVTVKLKTPQSDNVQLSVCSMSGAIVEKQNYLLQKGENSISIDTGGLSAGAYLLIVEGTHFKRQVKTFIKP
jgi:hypothetical protein